MPVYFDQGILEMENNLPTDNGVGTRAVALILERIPPDPTRPTVAWLGCCVVIVTGL